MSNTGRTKKFFYNTVSTALLQIVTLIAGFIVPKYMLRYYGSELNGLVTSISQFIAYFNLVEAGLSGAAVFALYKPIAQKDSDAINGIVSASRKHYIQAGYIFTSLTLGLAIIYPALVSTDKLTPLFVGFLVMVLGSNGFLDFFALAKYRVLLTADQKTYVISLASIVQIIAQTLIIMLLSQIGLNIVFLRLIAVASILLKTLILTVYCKIRYKGIDYNAKPDFKALSKHWDVLYLQILGAIQQGTAVILLTLIVGDLNLVSIYSVYNIVISGINNVLSIFTSGLAASFGDVISRNETEILQKSYREFEFAYYMLLTFAYSVTLIMIMSFVRIYTADITDVNYDLPVVGVLMTLNGFLYNLKTPQGMLVGSAGLYRETRWQTTAQGLIALIPGIILAIPFGLTGILAAAILSNVYRDIDLLFFIPKHVTKLSFKYTLFNWLKMGITIGLILLCSKFLYYNPTNWTQWFIYACIISVVAIAVILLMALIFDRKLLGQLFGRIKSVFARSGK
ncbi:MAG: hypothetical protein ACI4S9_08810 [Christensenellales bacterium]